ncbi:MAG: F0F1 ATP synthase subunit B [Bacteroidales bacterium]|nr:F0F1 ATP synthase subunit B [Bacteroidales bacterium]
MKLITPDFGLIFWMTLAFGIVFLVLAKVAFPIIGKALKKREEKITEALELAERTHEEMKQLQADNEKVLQEAREERDKILTDARSTRDRIIEEAKAKATEETNRIVETAKETIENERKAALTDIKNEIANISIKVAEKILEKQLDSNQAQMDYIERIIKETENNN